MSWEVLTMRSATSFFNGAIARSDLRRYWPALFLYVGLWLLFLPIPVWNRAAERNPAMVNLTELCADTYAAAVVLALIFGGIMATAVFSYLMQTRSVGAMHALPQRRGTLFWTHFLTGWAMLAAGNLLVLAVTALAALLGGLALTPALLTWFVVATLLDLIFLALGILCAMVTGWLLAVPVLYAAVNCLAVALTWLGQQLAELLLDGFTMPDAQPVITRWLTPVYQLICDLGQSGPSYSPFLTGKLPDDRIQNADCASGLAPQGWRTLLIFTAVALVLTVLSRLLYGRRKSELSGDAAAFSWMRPVFRLGVGLVGGLPLGMLLYVLVSVGRSGDLSPARLCVCMAVMGIVCYLAAAMLVGKTLRVLPKRLPGAAVTALDAEKTPDGEALAFKNELMQSDDFLSWIGAPVIVYDGAEQSGKLIRARCLMRESEQNQTRARLETLIARWNEDAVSAADILAVSTEAKNVVVNLSGGFAAWLQTLDGDAAREKVYSMVNTMTQGRSQQGVIFFFNGEQLDELSGGLCMRGRLTRNPGMVVNDDGSMGVL